jgi:UDP-N-acetylmuramoyl-L-alanyl-D-glutamate--2,6-diaminopimelate ligase
VVAGVPAGTELQVEQDRAAAIAGAIAAAGADDLVLIAGKGHEDYQILGTSRIHFDDREEAEKALRARLR